MKLKKITISVAAILLSAFMVQATDYRSMIRSVVSNNPSLKSERMAAEADITAMQTENNLPDPEIGFEHRWGRNGIGNKWGISVSQGFDWPGVYSARGAAISTASKAMEFLNRSNMLDKMLEIKLAMIDIVYARKNLEVSRQILNYIDELYAATKKGVDHGEITKLDLNKIAIERVGVAQRLTSQERTLLQSIAILESLNGGEKCDDIVAQLNEYPDDILFSAEQYVEMIKNNDPQYEANTLMSRSSKQMAKAARRSSLPGFNLGYIYEYELGERFNGASISVTVPIFSTRRKAKAATLEGTAYELQNVALLTDRSTSLLADRSAAVSLMAEIEQYRPIFDKDDNIKLSKKAYEGGQISLMEYLQDMNYFLTAQQDYMTTIYQYHLTMARLNKYLLLD